MNKEVEEIEKELVRIGLISKQSPLAKAIRHTQGKPKWGLVNFESLVPMVRQLEWGVENYGAFNWKKGLDKVETLESLIRHTMALIDAINSGEENKQFDGTGVHHIGAIMANAMMYSYFEPLTKEVREPTREPKEIS